MDGTFNHILCEANQSTILRTILLKLLISRIVHLLGITVEQQLKFLLTHQASLAGHCKSQLFIVFFFSPP
jgi:hypothetical protein